MNTCVLHTEDCSDTHIYICIYIYFFGGITGCTCMHTYIHTYIHTCIRLRSARSTFIAMFLLWYYGMYIHTRTHACMHTYIHTYIRIGLACFTMSDNALAATMIHKYIHTYIQAYIHTTRYGLFYHALQCFGCIKPS